MTKGPAYFCDCTVSAEAPMLYHICVPSVAQLRVMVAASSAWLTLMTGRSAWLYMRMSVSATRLGS